MSGSYIQCPECGKRALSVATRCPQCAHEFPARPLPRAGRASDVARFLPLLAVAGVATAAVVLVTAVIGRAGRAQAEEDSSSSAALRLDTAMAAASPAPPAASVAERRFARTWTNVRARRSPSGDVEAVLLPGDTVLADSLVRGWWRVTLDGEVMGYVYRSTLVPEPPPAAP